MTDTDRSRIIAEQVCPRSRFLGYEIQIIGPDGKIHRGLQRIRKSLPLQFGSAFHIGAPSLLKGAVEGAIADALQFLQQEFDSHQISLDDRELPADAQVALDYGKEEQMALAEALLRAWYAVEGEAFLQAFEVLSVEEEGRARLTDDLTLMFRPDAVIKDRMSGDNFLLSWKTCSTFGKRNTDQARTDMQSMSEVFGVQQTRGIKVEGVIYKFVVKSRRVLDKFDGLYKQQSPLIYGWCKLNTLKTEFPEWSWSYSWDKEDGSGEGRLGKGWQRKAIWRDYPGGVKAWIDDLANQRVFPRHVDALAQVFPQALPVERRADEVESWKEQTVFQEKNVAQNVIDVQRFPERLNVLFPQYSHSCHSYSGCPFIPCCWEGAKAEVGDLYQIRLQNHPESGGEDE